MCKKRLGDKMLNLCGSNEKLKQSKGETSAWFAPMAIIIVECWKGLVSKVLP